MNGLMEVVYKQSVFIYFVVSTFMYAFSTVILFLFESFYIRIFTFDPKKTKKQMDCILNMLNKFEGGVIF